MGNTIKFFKRVLTHDTVQFEEQRVSGFVCVLLANTSSFLALALVYRSLSLT